MGFGIIKIHENNMELIDLIEYKLPNKDDHSVKLSKIFKKTSELIKSHNPDLIAIEAPFFGKNVQSMLTLAKNKLLKCSKACLKLKSYLRISILPMVWQLQFVISSILITKILKKNIQIGLALLTKILINLSNFQNVYKSFELCRYQ